LILVCGATGYIGGRLAQALLEQGESVRCMARDADEAGDLRDAGAEIVEADLLEPETLPAAVDGIETAYYLVHSMGRGGGDGDFEERDHEAAENFAEAASDAGVTRIVYLGGLGDETTSKHLRSRHKTAEALAESGIPLTYFRAAAVIGSGSESLLTVYYLVKRLPVMLTPSWTKNETQPIAIGDLISYLAAAPGVAGADGRTIELGGPETTTYAGMMDTMADALDTRRRPRLDVPLLTPKLSANWIGLVTPVDSGVAEPLVEGLATPTVVEDPSGMALFDVAGTRVLEAMRAAVDEAEA